MTERQKRIIDARRDAGDEVYIDEYGNIEPETNTDFNFNGGSGELDNMQSTKSNNMNKEETEGEDTQATVAKDPTPAEAAEMAQTEREGKIARNKAALEAKKKEEERVERRDLNLRTNSTSAGFTVAANLMSNSI